MMILSLSFVEVIDDSTVKISICTVQGHDNGVTEKLRGKRRHEFFCWWSCVSPSRLHMHAWVCSMCGCVFPLHARNIALSVSKNESLTLPKKGGGPSLSQPPCLCVFLCMCVCYSGSAISLECSVRCQREKSLQWHAHITLQKHQDDLKRPESEETGPVLLCVSCLAGLPVSAARTACTLPSVLAVSIWLAEATPIVMIRRCLCVKYGKTSAAAAAPWP